MHTWIVLHTTFTPKPDVVYCNTTDTTALVAIEIASIDNSAELKALTRKTYILITCVGPYSLYGDEVIKTCIETSTHYLDVTGEFPWVREMISKYDQAAKDSGAFIFPQIGLESAPPDMCTYAMAGLLRNELGAKTGDVTICLYTLE
jgi:short subunit dehydrogenase-like uncharacterized protein